MLSRRLRLAAEALGPTYLKLCQIISSGEGIFPAELVEEMRKCRDQVPAQPWAVVEQILIEELGGPVSETFSSIDRIPLAAASIAQVHAATLLDGTEVVVKVQRRGIARLVQDDLRVMSAIAPLLVGRIPITSLANPPALVELFAETICEELDFRLEAENMIDLTGVFAELGETGFVIPTPHPTLVTRRMLVMERLRGFDFDDVDRMREGGIDTHEVVRIGMRGFTSGCMIHGIFHGDLHGGNLLVLDDGRIGLLDFGICARMTPVERIALLAAGPHRWAPATSPGRSRHSVIWGRCPPTPTSSALIADLGLDQELIDPTTMDGDQLVAEIQRVIAAAHVVWGQAPQGPHVVRQEPRVSRRGDRHGWLPISTPRRIRGPLHPLTAAHGAQIARDLGEDPAEMAADREAIKASFGIVDPDMDTLTIGISRSDVT